MSCLSSMLNHLVEVVWEESFHVQYHVACIKHQMIYNTYYRCQYECVLTSFLSVFQSRHEIV